MWWRWPKTYQQLLSNDTDKPLDVYVEPASERYELRPGDFLTATYSLRGSETPLSIFIHTEGIRIWPSADGHELVISINGTRAAPLSDG